MKRMLALLLTAMLILTLLPGCGKKDPGGDAPEVPENPTEQGGETPEFALASLTYDLSPVGIS